VQGLTTIHFHVIVTWLDNNEFRIHGIFPFFPKKVNEQFIANIQSSAGTGTSIASSVATLLSRKTPEFTLKKKTENKTQTYEMFQKSKRNLKCTLAILVHNN